MDDMTFSVYVTRHASIAFANRTTTYICPVAFAVLEKDVAVRKVHFLWMMLAPKNDFFLFNERSTQVLYVDPFFFDFFFHLLTLSPS